MRAMKDSGIAWIGEIPADWSITILSALFYERKCKNRGLVEKNLLSLSYGNIVRKSIESNEGLLPASFETYNIVESGNIVFRLTDLQNDKRSLRTGLCKERGIITSAYVTLQIRSDDSPRYMHYLFHTYDLCKVFYGLGDGVRQGMNYEDLKHLQVLRPDLKTQHRIADYLDRKCSQIDAIIARQQEVVEKLKAYKLSVITEAVTKGLNPHAPMKDSGVEWIGEIPEQWKVAKLKFVASFCNGDRSSKYPSGTDIVDEGVIFVTSNNLGNTFLDTTISTKYITKEKCDDLGGAKIRINDIIFCLRGSVGKCSINKSENEGTIASSLVVIRAKKILADYLIFALQCPGITAVSTLNAIGIGSLNLSADDISEIFIPIPPEKEAAEIAEFLYKRIGKIDHVINEKNNYVNHFVMYKRALIYEIVTGKKDV